MPLGVRDPADDEDIIIGIPGPWRDLTSFKSALQKKSSGKFAATARTVRDLQKNDTAKFNFRTGFPELAEAIGNWRLDPDTVEALKSHRSMVDLFMNYQGPETYDRLLRLTEAVRNAGGMAVRVEIAGVSHSWQDWRDYLSSEFDIVRFRALVILVPETDRMSSFGMAQFRLPDAENHGAPETVDVAALIEQFNFYHWLENPTILDGQTFSVAKDAPRFRLSHSPDRRYPPNDIYFNKYGIWRLDYIDEEAERRK